LLTIARLDAKKARVASNASVLALIFAHDLSGAFRQRGDMRKKMIGVVLVMAAD